MTTVEDAIAAHAAGAISAPVALMRIMLTGMSVSELLRELAARAASADDPTAALRDEAYRRRPCLETLERVVAAGTMHPGTTAVPAEAVARVRAMFDHLVAVSPEASVAAYSLADPALLQAATAEIIGWLRHAGLLAGRPDVLDLGCGIGRLAAALAADASTVLGLDLSAGMIAMARARHGHLPGVRFRLSSGCGLTEIAPASTDLVLAVDVLPYIVEAGTELTERHIAEAARVLRRDGSLVILNYSYRDITRDRADIADVARRHGLAVLSNGAAPFRLWDGRAFWLRKGG